MVPKFRMRFRVGNSFAVFASKIWNELLHNWDAPIRTLLKSHCKAHFVSLAFQKSLSSNLVGLADYHLFFVVLIHFFKKKFH